MRVALSILVAAVWTVGAGFATSAEAAAVVVTKLKGPGSPKCRDLLKSLVGTKWDRVDWKMFGEARPNPDQIGATMAWLRGRSKAMPYVRVAVLASKRGTEKLRIDVFELPKAKLVGIKTFKVSARSCKLTKRRKSLAKRWLRKLIGTSMENLPAVVAKADANILKFPDGPVGPVGPGGKEKADDAEVPEMPPLVAIPTLKPKTDAPKPAVETDTPKPEPKTEPPPTVEPKAEPKTETQVAKPETNTEPKAEPKSDPDTEPTEPDPPEKTTVADGTASELTETGDDVTGTTGPTQVIEPKRKKRRRRFPFFALDLGLAFSGRDWTYVDPGQASLRDYELGATPSPQIRLELHPFAAAKRTLAPLAVDIEYRSSVGVESFRPETGVRHPTSLTDLTLALRYKFGLGEGGRGPYLSPLVAFRNTQFSLRSPDNGPRDNEVPNLDYRGIAVGAWAEIPLQLRIKLIASAAYVFVLSQGQALGEGGFFADSSASGFQVQGTLRFRVWGPVSTQLGAGLLRYFVSFDEGGARTASGARDDNLVVNAGFRFEH